MKRYAGENIRLDAYSRGGYYILRLSYYTYFTCATKKKGVYHAHTDWTDPVEKKFVSATGANEYYRKVKETYPDIRIISNEPGKYIDHEGKLKDYGSSI